MVDIELCVLSVMESNGRTGKRNGILALSFVVYGPEMKWMGGSGK
jgi:hypothetical protein